MAVNVDTVYQKVLAFANKEQRGYITPQEFNLFADQAQMEIFEQYFYDINQFRRIPGNNYAYGNALDNLKDKVSLFIIYDYGVSLNPSYYAPVITELPDLYRIGTVKIRYKTGDKLVLCEELEAENEFEWYENSPLTKYSKKYPVYIKRRLHFGSFDPEVRIYPVPTAEDVANGASVWITYVKKPAKVNWGYVVVNDKPLYNSSTSQDFELHLAEESELVYRILAFAGIAIEKPQLTQVAVGLEGAKQQQEKQ